MFGSLFVQLLVVGAMSDVSLSLLCSVLWFPAYHFQTLLGLLYSRIVSFDAQLLCFFVMVSQFEGAIMFLNVSV